MTGDGAFVGRSAELRTAIGMLTGKSGVLAMTGEPGIGKTRLLAQLCAAASRQRYQVLTATPTEFERNVPYGALIGALDDAGLADSELARLLCEPAATPGDRYGVKRQVRTLLGAMAKHRGLVLALDDLHWADPALVELASYLVRRPSPFLLVLCYRPRQVDPRIEDALAGCDATVIPLTPLSTEDSRVVLGPGLSRARSAELVAEAGGNPLFLRSLRDAGSGPDGLRGAVGRAILSETATLPDYAVTVARAAAIAGDPFECGLVAAIADQPVDDVARAVDALVVHDLVRPSNGPRFRFRHPLVRRVLYACAPAGWRAQAHHRAAAALESWNAPAIARAHHVARSASFPDETAANLLAEAASSTLSTAPATAAGLLTEAVRLLPTECQEQRAELRLALARAYALMGRLTTGREIAHQVRDELPPELAQQRAEAVSLVAMTNRLLGRHAEARAVLLAEIANSDSAALRLELVAGGLLAGDFAPVLDMMREAVRAAERAGDRPLSAAAAAVLALASYGSGQFDAGLVALSQAQPQVDALSDGELTHRLDAIVWLAWAEMFLERFQRCIDHFHRALALARTTGQGHLLPYILVGLSNAHLLLGNHPDALDWAIEASEAADESGSDELLTMALSVRCLIETRMGDRESALDSGKRAAAAVGSVQDWWAATVGMAHGQARLASGEAPGTCIDDILRACGGPKLSAVDPGNRPYFYEALAHAELIGGDPHAALGWVDRMDDAIAGLGAGATFRAAVAQLVRAEVLLATGQPMPAADYASAAVETFVAADTPFLVARSLLVTGQVLGASGQRAHALKQLGRAQNLFVRTGAPRFADRAAKAQRQLGHRVGGSRRPDGVDSLTGRETEIARLVADGRTNRQIAGKLVLSERTVEAHLRNIRAKLDAPTRTAVAAALARADA